MLTPNRAAVTDFVLSLDNIRRLICRNYTSGRLSVEEFTAACDGLDSAWSAFWAEQLNGERGER